jgi:hypothetical protein
MKIGKAKAIDSPTAHTTGSDKGFHSPKRK